MPRLECALRTGRLAAMLLMTASAAASAHGTGASSHGGASRAGTTSLAHTHASAARTPSLSSQQRSAVSDPPGTLPGTTTTTTPAPPPNFSAQCEGEVSANCEATAQSRFTVSGGDAAPVWTAPTPTAVPPTPPTDPINEPQDTTTQNFEQSGGASGVVITEGGGPTLADCMALWEPAVHMSKPLWKNVCIRTMNGINEPEVALGSVDPSSAPSHRARHARHVARN
jgi:hypothetical protein